MDILKKITNSTKWSVQGLQVAYKRGISFKLEIAVVIVLIPLAIYIAKDLNQFLWLLFSVNLVLIVELINTSIESTVDRISKSKSKLAKDAKDSGSAAVFYAILFAIVVWILIISRNWYYS